MIRDVYRGYEFEIWKSCEEWKSQVDLGHRISELPPTESLKKARQQIKNMVDGIIQSHARDKAVFL